MGRWYYCTWIITAHYVSRYEPRSDFVPLSFPQHGGVMIGPWRVCHLGYKSSFLLYYVRVSWPHRILLVTLWSTLKHEFGSSQISAHRRDVWKWKRSRQLLFNPPGGGDAIFFEDKSTVNMSRWKKVLLQHSRLPEHIKPLGIPESVLSAGVLHRLSKGKTNTAVTSPVRIFTRSERRGINGD